MNDFQEFNFQTIIFGWKKILTFITVFSALAFLISAVITPKYGSEIEILILQKNIDIDAYRATKASEFAGEVLKRVINSSDFMLGTLSRAGENHLKYGEIPEDQIKNWGKAVQVSTFGSTGILKITVSDEDRKVNRKITESIAGELLDNGINYHGNKNIFLKKISGPVYFKNPIFPIIWLNVLVAGIAGLFFSIGFIFLSERRKE